MYKPELDEVLKRHLKPVKAPEGLWDATQARMPVPPFLARKPAPLFAVAAMAAFMVVAFHPRQERTVQVKLPQHNLTLHVAKSVATQEALNATCQLCHAGV